MTWTNELVRYRHLLWMLAPRDIMIKYKQSVLGVLWAILMPTVIVLAGIVVKLAFATVSGKALHSADIASVSVKSVPWAFFVASIRFSTNSLIGNANLVTKIYFPRMVLPLASILSQFFDFLIASILLAVILLVLGIPISVNLIWVPLLVGILVVFIVGLALVLSATSLFFRDVKYIVEIVLMFAIFFTPVFYETSMFGEWSTVMLLNPVAPILEGLRAAVVEQRTPDVGWVGYSALVSLLTLALGVWLFRRMEPSFAECI